MAADEDEKHMEVIRIDGQLRKNLRVSLNDTVSITKASSKNGKLDNTSFQLQMQ